ncbi:hypothetical protein scyTo_0019436 [Scyliorhinus torazame]|uniref:Uncharacterized protein n=1 Tax=Scyliorhinus torazame TaxID=75743 RepID=A0A401PZM1_SCYTO|nr:hypothetical protein [Scyliorhinus torazame]
MKPLPPQIVSVYLCGLVYLAQYNSANRKPGSPEGDDALRGKEGEEEAVAAGWKMRSLEPPQTTSPLRLSHRADGGQLGLDTRVRRTPEQAAAQPSTHIAHATFQVDAFDSSFILDVELNQQEIQKSENTQEQFQKQLLPHCYQTPKQPSYGLT